MRAAGVRPHVPRDMRQAMLFAEVHPAFQAFVRDLLGRTGFDAGRFHLDMAPGDEMFFKGILPSYPDHPGAAVYRYVESSLRTFGVYAQLAAALGGFGALERVLDFGSGYGRLTRALRHRLDPARLWVSDIYADAVAWQQATFGVHGVVSAPDPDGFAATGEFSIVFAASVFSHLPDGLFQRWLARLYGHVAPRGLLAFSVHDRALAPEGQTIGPDGIGYGLWSESDTLDPAIYGMSYVSEAFVRRAVAEACGERAGRTLRRFPRALFENQDLYVVGGADANLGGLEVLAPPLGGMSRFGRPERPWSGWGLELNPGRRIVRAELFIDDAPAGQVAPGAGDPDVARFFPGAPNPPVSWAFDPAPGTGERLVRVTLLSDTGQSAHVYGMLGMGEGPAAPRT